MKKRNAQKGFTLLEMLVALVILMIVAGTVIGGMMQMTWSEGTVMNRTQLHSSVRNATETMQQEIGQAGRITSQPGLQSTSAISVPAGSASVSATTTLTTTSTTSGAAAGLFVGEQVVFDPSSTAEETVTLTAVDHTTQQVTANFSNSHAANVPVLVLGGFASGVVPPTGKFIFSGTGTTNTTLDSPTAGQSSTGFLLKLYGDIYGDGLMYYVVYSCAPNSTGTGMLKRYVVQRLNSGTAVTLGNSGATLLDTLALNPNNEPCFTYTTKDVAVTINGGQVTQTFVVNVAVTLTVQTQNIDPQTGVAQTETKALLNVAPRNVFDAWELASAPSGYTRAQPMPDNVLKNFLTATLY